MFFQWLGVEWRKECNFIFYYYNFLEIFSTKCCFPSFWCTYSSLIDRAHSTRLCTIICIPVVSFLETKCENPGFSMRYSLPITWEEFSLFQTSFFSLWSGRKELSEQLLPLQYQIRHGVGYWGWGHMEAAHQLLPPLVFHRTKPAGQGIRIQSQSSAGTEHTASKTVWKREGSWYQLCAGRTWWLRTLGCGCPGINPGFDTG